jgi:hypothetical protein
MGVPPMFENAESAVLAVVKKWSEVRTLQKYAEI